ncbi:MAG: hypothetical protein R3C03_23245 [Pirellulaceae bacterium]
MQRFQSSLNLPTIAIAIVAYLAVHIFRIESNWNLGWFAYTQPIASFLLLTVGVFVLNRGKRKKLGWLPAPFVALAIAAPF